MKLVRSISKSLPWVFALVATVGVVGCAEPAPEPKGSTTAKLLAPRPVFKAKASPVSQSAFGITEWRLYRGKRDVVLTGFDAKGKAVKGVSVGFHAASKSGGKAVLRTRMLDGSLFAARHVYGGTSTSNKKIGTASDKFLRIALRDLESVHASIDAKKKTAAGNQSVMPPGAECGGDMAQILMQAITCVMSSGNDPNALMQCILAAQSAGGVGGACMPTDPSGGTGGYPTDPSGGTGGTGGYPTDPSGGTGGDPTDPSGGTGGYPTDPYDPSGGAGGNPGDPYDPSGGGYPGDDGMGGGGYPYPEGGTGGAGYPDEGTGGGGYPGDIQDPYGDGSMCPSCSGGGGSDIYPDPYGGGVDYEGGFEGDYGEGY